MTQQERAKMVEELKNDVSKLVERLTERADKAEKTLREQTEETARWICKYHGDANRFQRMKGELAAAERREARLREALTLISEDCEDESTVAFVVRVLRTLYPDKEREPNG